MQVQLALDLLDPEQALSVVEQVHDVVDIIEVGTSLLKLSGIAIVDQIREIAPDAPIFVDAKIIDGPQREADLMAECAPRYYSMLAVAADTAVSRVLETAGRTGSEVVFDLQSVADPARRAQELVALGATALCVHKNTDHGGAPADSFADVLAVRAAGATKVSVAGGISTQSLPLIDVAVAPDIVIIGGAILAAPDPRAAALEFRALATGSPSTLQSTQ
ncbi:orotidine 5'-phosphate decarboxylase / HUMPS family protein [Tsukamurella spumae]|uniref:Orotidine 5'-phosphate decarboxylase domain-containing protein n=1 Tax=Tsukamurella spumae TaxID=44753 RepID=A0A846X8E0_9ACTN|nr:orotidine 5'-phosphate decarboxylase / HUMPS family protein [Tsukamurella spumae]NKY20726.1 hypothetical protein [Tsukamurella spumae]